MLKKILQNIAHATVSIVTLSVPARAFILDDKNAQIRPISGEQKITPIEESIARGESETFAQFTGQISYLLGQNEKGNNLWSCSIGTLIGTNILITSAHTSIYFLENPTKGHFTLINGSTVFKARLKTVFLPNEYPKNETHKTFSSELKTLSLEMGKKMAEYELFKSQNGITEEMIYQLMDPAMLMKIIDNPELTDLERTKLKISFKTLLVYVSEVSKIKRKKELCQERYKSYQAIEAKNDIAIILLEQEIADIKQFPILDNGKNNTSRAYGVSVNSIRKNSDGSKVFNSNNNQRHIGIFDTKKENSLLQGKLKLPNDYKDPDSTEIGPKRFMYNYNQEKSDKGDPFLKASCQLGDSGSPLLLSRKNDTPVIAGILGTIRTLSQTEDLSQTEEALPPGGEFLNIWTPTNAHLEWIQKTIQSINS